MSFPGMTKLFTGPGPRSGPGPHSGPGPRSGPGPGACLMEVT